MRTLFFSAGFTAQNHYVMQVLEELIQVINSNERFQKADDKYSQYSLP